MNARARILVQSELSLDNFIAWLFELPTLVFIFLLTTVFATSIAIVYVKDRHRQLTHELQALVATRASLEVEREQLLLEEGTWLAGSRISEFATTHLQMRAPLKVNHIAL